MLVEAECDIEKVDKLKRTPLSHAVKNGQLEVARYIILGMLIWNCFLTSCFLYITSYLLHMGSSPASIDSSKNTPAHYAAAFGWLECLKFLVDCGADSNAVNDWYDKFLKATKTLLTYILSRKTTPLAIAMLKGHLAIADYLLEREGVDVNIKDEEGRTLVGQALGSGEISETTLTQLEYLVCKKGANAVIADFKGHTPLHLLAMNYDPHKKKDKKGNNFGMDSSDDDGDNDGDEDEDAMEDEEDGGDDEDEHAAMEEDGEGADEDAMEEDKEEEKEKDEEAEEEEDEEKEKEKEAEEEEDEGASNKKGKGKGKGKKGKEKAKEEEKEDLSVRIARILLDNGGDVNALSQVCHIYSPYCFIR